MQTYRVGQVWEREGGRREIVAIVIDGYVRGEASALEVFYIDWKRPGSDATRKATWCSTWIAWASKARLVSDPTDN